MVMNSRERRIGCDRFDGTKEMMNEWFGIKKMEEIQPKGEKKRYYSALSDVI